MLTTKSNGKYVLTDEKKPKPANPQSVNFTQIIEII